MTPELAEIIREAIESRLIDVHTALPGEVVAVDAVTRTAEIRPLLTRWLEKEDGSFIQENLPVIPNVKNLEIRGLNFFVSVPVEVGTTGLLIFSEASLDIWRQKNQVSPPGDVGRHTLTGAVFLPGLFAAGEELPTQPTDALVVGHKNGTVVTIESDTIKGENSSGDFELKSSGQFSVNSGTFTVDP